MKKIIYIDRLLLMAILLIPLHSLLGQSVPNFYSIVKDKEAYFNQLAKDFGSQINEEEGSEYNAYLKWKIFWENRIAPHGDFTKYFKGEKDYFDNLKKGGIIKSGNTGDWYEVGPLSPPSCGIGNNYSVGVIRFISFFRNDANYILCGSVACGIFSSTDGGNTWTNGGSDVGWNNSGANSVTFSINDHDTWYGANAGALGYENGIWRTFDAGVTWEMIADQSQLNGVWTEIKKLVMDPVDPNAMYAATSDGLYKTTNANAVPANTVVWNKIYPSGGSLPIHDVEFRNNSVLYISIPDLTSPYTDANILYSNDYGANWNSLQSILPNLNNAKTIEMEVSDAAADDLWLLYDYYSGDKLYRFNTVTNNYQTLNSSITVNFWGQALGVSNFNSDVVMVVDNIGAKRTTNNGSNWSSMSGFHVDIEDLIGFPSSCSTCSQDFLMANHGGIYRSYDQGASWVQKSNGIGNAMIIGMSTSNTNPAKIAIGLDHDGTAISNGSYGINWLPTWCTVYSCDGQQPRIDYSNENNVWYTGHCGQFSNEEYKLSTTYDQNYSTTNIDGNWYSDIVQNIADPAIVYGRQKFGAVKNVIRANNYGFGTEEQISDFASPPYSLITDVGEWSLHTAPANANYLYIHVVEKPDGGGPLPDNHYIFRTTELTNTDPLSIWQTWKQCAVPSCCFNRWISDIEVDLENPDIIYMCYNGTDASINGLANGMVFKADYTGGVSNQPVDITYNLPPADAVDISLEKGSDGGIYVYTNRGVFFTNNARIQSNTSTAWVRLGDNLPHLSGYIDHSEINYTANKIRVGTYGRGVWEHDLYCPGDYDLVYAPFPHLPDLFAEAEHDIESQATVLASNNATYRAGNQIRLLPGFKTNAGSKFHAFIHPCNHSGNSFKKISNTVFVSDEEKEYENEIAQDEINPFIAIPNPNKGSFRIKQLGNKYIVNSVCLLDLQGRQIMEIKNPEIENESFSFNVDYLKNGVYFVKLKSRSNEWNLKVSICK